jgi:hypothetical protein
MAMQVPLALSGGKSLLSRPNSSGRPSLSVRDGEGGIEPYPLGKFSQKTGDGVESSG